MERKNWTLRINRYDRRCRDGERLYGRYEYYDKTHSEMKAEIKDLQYKLYPDPHFRIDLVERRNWVLTIQEMSNTDRSSRKFHGRYEYYNKDTFEMNSVVGLFYRTMYRSDMFLIGFRKLD